MSEDFLELHRLGMKLKFVYSVIGLVLGLSCIISGSILGLYGVVGNSSFTASFLGLSTQLNDATPGVVIFVVGIFIVYITRFKVINKNNVFPDHASEVTMYKMAMPIIEKQKKPNR